MYYVKFQRYSSRMFQDQEIFCCVATTHNRLIGVSHTHTNTDKYSQIPIFPSYTHFPVAPVRSRLSQHSLACSSSIETRKVSPGCVCGCSFIPLFHLLRPYFRRSFCFSVSPTPAPIRSHPIQAFCTHVIYPSYLQLYPNSNSKRNFHPCVCVCDVVFLWCMCAILSVPEPYITHTRSHSVQSIQPIRHTFIDRFAACCSCIMDFVLSHLFLRLSFYLSFFEGISNT